MNADKVEARAIVAELSGLVKSFVAGNVSAEEAWRVLQGLSANLQELLAKPGVSEDAELMEYLRKCNLFREKAAVQILDKLKQEGISPHQSQEDGGGGGGNTKSPRQRPRMQHTEQVVAVVAQQQAEPEKSPRSPRVMMEDTNASGGGVRGGAPPAFIDGDGHAAPPAKPPRVQVVAHSSPLTLSKSSGPLPPVPSRSRGHQRSASSVAGAVSSAPSGPAPPRPSSSPRRGLPRATDSPVLSSSPPPGGSTSPRMPHKMTPEEHGHLLAAVEEHLNDLLASVTKQQPSDSMRQLQDITHQLQTIDAHSSGDPGCLETAKRLTFFREEIAVRIVELSNDSAAAAALEATPAEPSRRAEVPTTEKSKPKGSGQKTLQMLRTIIPSGGGGGKTREPADKVASSAPVETVFSTEEFNPNSLE